MEATMPQAVSVVHKKGRVGMVGMLRGKQSLVFDYASGSKLQMGEVDVIGVSGFYFWGNDPEFKIVIDLLSQGKLLATEMITHRFPLEKINEAFETVAAKDKTKALKAVVEP
jgi:threonine dehydrogenase-like Zn-dependent dehydrogenase